MTRGHDPTTEPPRDRRTLQRATDDLNRLTHLNHQLRRTLATWRDWTERGYQSTTIPETISGGHPTSRPPRGTNLDPNPAALGYEAIHDALDHIHHATNTIETKTAMALNPPVQDLGLPGCRSCARIWDHDHHACRTRSQATGNPIDHDAAPWYQPVYVKAERLCQWCYRFTRDWDQLPPTEVLVARRQGRKITTRLIRDHLDVA